MSVEGLTPMSTLAVLVDSMGYLDLQLGGKGSGRGEIG